MISIHAFCRYQEQYRHNTAGSDHQPQNGRHFHCGKRTFSMPVIHKKPVNTEVYGDKEVLKLTYH